MGRLLVSVGSWAVGHRSRKAIRCSDSGALQGAVRQGRGTARTMWWWTSGAVGQRDRKTLEERDGGTVG